jgi:hypothetical protein
MRRRPQPRTLGPDWQVLLREVSKSEKSVRRLDTVLDQAERQYLPPSKVAPPIVKPPMSPVPAYFVSACPYPPCGHAARSHDLVAPGRPVPVDAGCREMLRPKPGESIRRCPCVSLSELVSGAPKIRIVPKRET